LNNPISDLVELSQYAAKHPDFVQGGGGNCSVKFSNKMAIKASGCFLEEVSLKNGYVLLDLMEKNSAQGIRPSMETPIHSLLGTYVVHTHPILVGGLVCVKKGKTIFKELFNYDNYFWIDYVSPGNELYEKVKNVFISSNADINKDLALFVENHGLFISSPIKLQCITLHESIINKLKEFFNYNDESIGLNHINITDGKFLTPDHVVYSNLSKNQASNKNKVAVSEIVTFSRKVTSIILLKGLEIQYLSNEACNFILNIEGEKYRQQM
jgi:rhamnose utilization protein RhaD (predicted bifunctional aldolase and dehydrogenase)